MPPFGFIGATYVAQSPIADCERAINLYPEAIESGKGKNDYYLVRAPGLKAFCTLPKGPVLQLFETAGRVFAVAGGGFYEIYADGTSKMWGAASTTAPVSMASNGYQIFIASAGNGWLFDLGSGAYTEVLGFDGATQVCSIDGYFVALNPNSARFQISGLLDGSTWDGLDFATVEGAPGDVLSMIADHRELWFLKQRSAEVFYDSGNPDFPFERNQGGFVEYGIGAAETLRQLDNTIFWLATSPRGGKMVVRVQGYTPQRISNHSVENAIRSYGDVSNAVAYGYQDNGHSFYVLTFPTADATWVYDVATNLWHERAAWDPVHAQWKAHRGRCYCYGFDRNLVGDYLDGRVYEMSLDFYDDDGAPQRWLRQAPHLANEGKRNFYQALTLDMEVGVGTNTGQGSDPQAILRWSDDGGRTWSNEYAQSIGRIGQWRKRVIWRQLGQARDRVFQVSGTDPVKIALINAYLDAKPGAY